MGFILFSNKIIKILSPIPALIYMVFIFYLSSQSSIPYYIDVPNIDKLFHFIIYFILGLLLSLIPISRTVLILIGILYGASDEFHQSFIEGRECSLIDFLFDSLGILLAFAGVWFWKKKRSS